jgi:hypothetical protein
VDITPSINSFLNVKVPEAQLREVDGISLIGAVSVAQPEANLVQGSLDVSWKAMDGKGKVKIWVAAANNYKEGKADEYKLLAEVPVPTEHALIDVKNMPSNFYKVAIEGELNTVNRWVIVK